MIQQRTNAALDYLETYIHPQAVIMDGTDDEEATFKEALDRYLKTSELSVINLPHQGAQRLPWIAKLDSASLSGMLNHPGLNRPIANKAA